MAGERQKLPERVLHFIQKYHLIPKQQRLLVAVSGGPDSVCLLHILVKLQTELDIELRIAHLDHQLRGTESAADAQYVADLAHRLGIPATIEQRDVKAFKARQHVSLEEAAREVRYTFLAGVARSIGASRVAVGHTTDDHIETILMHLIRGTGTRGLRGLESSTLWPTTPNELILIRPLLEVSRQETADYCHHHRLAPRIDTSNLSLSPLRNRIRLQLLPLLQSYNPRVDKALLRTARLAGDDLAYLEKEVVRLWNGIAQKQEGAITLDKERFLELPSVLKRHLLRKAIEELLGNLKDIETRHIEEIMAALTKPAGKRISLPVGLNFSIEYDRYLLAREIAALSPFPVLEAEFPLKIPGKTRLSGWRIEATIIDASVVKGKPEGALAPSETTTPLPLDKGKGIKGIGLINDNFTAHFDRGKVGSRLAIRPRQPGDRFQPLGMSQLKKLGEFMIDVKIPQSWRRRIPLVCSSQHILWVVGWRIDDRVKVTESTKQVLCLKFRRI
jgi:tRNA(Ile)-lysidine synthase